MQIPQVAPRADDPAPLPLPGWARPASADGAEEAAFRAGAALLALIQAAGAAGAGQGVPHPLWRDRLALAAAARGVAMSGRAEGEAALRDAVHLLRPGDHPGPAGAVFRLWSRAVARPLGPDALAPLLDPLPAALGADALRPGPGTPVARAARALAAALAHAPGAETQALILADATLSRAAGQDRLLPCLSLALTPRDLRLDEAALRASCHRALIAAAAQALPMAADLARRAARLRAVAPRLRAKAAARAVELFLSRDALPPAALTFMSDRAARRLCDRLVDLGALRELTGRDAFRLYGL